MDVQKKVRVRFAPSPTGGLHLGGVRTALFNYLFARRHGGDFVLRIEDTDQTRFVPGAEAYIAECLDWCGLSPDESPTRPGAFGPYRQSERKASYRQYAERLVRDGRAYYAFDTAEELEEQRKRQPNFRYSHENRMQLRNSLSLPEDETQRLLAEGRPHTVRIKVPAGQTVAFEDMIRGRVAFETGLLDDKVLLKADGMPTYHLAVVVDDRAMQISHVLRGEEWLPSAPVHVLLWEYLGWKAEMPQWAHLPLILKPNGNGKLSKRDGDRLGFPVYAMNWTDPKTGNLTKGFREMGFLPGAFVNMLALLGWNDGTEREIFALEELIDRFSIDRVSKSGAKFDFEKTKWFNQEWIKKTDDARLLPLIKDVLRQHIERVPDDGFVLRALSLVKDRMTFLDDFWGQSHFFFAAPRQYEVDSAIQDKWNPAKADFFRNTADRFEESEDGTREAIEATFKKNMEAFGLKAREVMLPFRIALVNGKFGPDVFEIAALLGPKETSRRMRAFCAGR